MADRDRSTVFADSREVRGRYSAVTLILTVIFGFVTLIWGVVHPNFNFDLIPYATLAKQMRGVGGKSETYQELAATASETEIQGLVSGPYRARMYRDDAFFKANLPFYRIRPLYILLSSVVGFLIGNDVMATGVVAAISTALAMILSYAIAQRIGPPTGMWRLVVPLAWAVSGGLSLATISTPDALSALVTLLFVYVWIGGPWTRARLIRLMLLSGLMVAARTDSVVFLMSLLLCESLFKPRHRFAASLIAVVALSACIVIQKLSGNYGYVAILNFTLIDGPLHDHVPNLVFNLSGYLRVFVHETIQVLGENYESSLFSLQVAC